MTLFTLEVMSAKNLHLGDLGGQTEVYGSELSLIGLEFNEGLSSDPKPSRCTLLTNLNGRFVLKNVEAGVDNLEV